MRIRFVVAILAVTLSLQTALAAVCSAGCATMTAGSAHHGSNAPMPAAPEVSGVVEHHGHHDASASEQIQASSELPSVSEITKKAETSFSATAKKCPLPDSTQQRQRLLSDLTLGTVSPSPVLLSEAKVLLLRASAVIPPDLSPPAGFTILRI